MKKNKKKTLSSSHTVKFTECNQTHIIYKNNYSRAVYVSCVYIHSQGITYDIRFVKCYLCTQQHERFGDNDRNVFFLHPTY